MSPSPTSPESTTPITDPGVTVANGEPEAINAAGNWHSALASKLEAHSALIKSTASALFTGWTGEASQQYQSLSQTMSGHYEVTAAEARSVASALKRFSAELGTAQGEGKVALQNAIHWMNEVNHWQTKLADAETAETNAHARVTAAMKAVIAANQAAAVSHPTSGAASAVATANQELSAARTALGTAQNDVVTAKTNLTSAADHFTSWQKKGGQALQDAEKAAGVAGLALGAVAISDPPLAGAINDAVAGTSDSVSGSLFAGYSASDGGGSALANWQALFQAGAGAGANASGSASIAGVQGDANTDGFAGEQGSLAGNAGWSQLGASATVNELGGAQAQADANGQLGLSGVGANVSGSAFAGVQANASGSAELGPADASGNVGVSAGVGVQASAGVDVTAHKIGVSWNVGATLGLGLDVSGSVSVDPSKVISDINRAMPWNW